MLFSIKKKPLSLAQMLAFWLGAMIIIPTLPLAIYAFEGYKSEASQLEWQLQDSNRQFAKLAAILFSNILYEVSQYLHQNDFNFDEFKNLPFDHFEELDKNGEIAISSISPERVGEILPEKIIWTSISTKTQTSFKISNVIYISVLKSRRVLVKVDDIETQTYRIAYMDPLYLHNHLTSRFDSHSNRHIYAIDKKGSPIFYSAPEVVEKPEVFRDNVPVKHFLDGKSGEVQYTSAISGHARLGFVDKMSDTGWAIVVSTDLARSMIDIKERLIWLITAVLLSVILAFATFVLFSYRLVLPITKLTREIRSKDRNPYSPISLSHSVTRIKELSQLVDDLNAYINSCMIAEKKTIQAEKLATLGELTTGLAHELGTPLNVVRGSAQLVKRKYPDDLASRSALDRIITQTGRITDLIRNLLDIARLEQVNPEVCDLKKLIIKSWETVTVMFPETECRFEFAQEQIMVLIRRRSMEHAFLNLFINACQAMNGIGAITISIDMDTEQYWKIEIEDTGPGIDPQHLKQIFKPFYSTKSAGQGSGLGLALVERVIRENDGSIIARFLKGHGAIFQISLPHYLNNETREQY